MSLITHNHTWNKQFSQVLGELADLMMRKGEIMKSRAYNRARDTIQSIDQDIKDIEQLKNTPDTLYWQLHPIQNLCVHWFHRSTFHTARLPLYTLSSGGNYFLLFFHRDHH